MKGREYRKSQNAWVSLEVHIERLLEMVCGMMSSREKRAAERPGNTT